MTVRCRGRTEFMQARDDTITGGATPPAIAQTHATPHRQETGAATTIHGATPEAASG